MNGRTLHSLAWVVFIAGLSVPVSYYVAVQAGWRELGPIGGPSSALAAVGLMTLVAALVLGVVVALATVCRGFIEGGTE